MPTAIEVQADTFGPTPPVREPRYYVNEYMVNQSYGGPEEGGWWYDVGTFVRCHAATQTLRAAQIARDTLEGYVAEENEGRYPLHSVLCSGVCRIYVEDYPGEDFPNVIPVYE